MAGSIQGAKLLFSKPLVRRLQQRHVGGGGWGGVGWGGVGEQAGCCSSGPVQPRVVKRARVQTHINLPLQPRPVDHRIAAGALLSMQKRQFG